MTWTIADEGDSVSDTGGDSGLRLPAAFEPRTRWQTITECGRLLTRAGGELPSVVAFDPSGWRELRSEASGGRRS